MKEMSQTLSEILQIVYSDKAFQDPKNSKILLTQSEKLAQMAHAMPKEKSDKISNVNTAPDSDLSVGLISSLFVEETKRAVSELKRGHKDYARSLLKSIPSFCLGCHTRAAAPGDAALKLPDVPKSFTPIEKGFFLAGSRRFDQSLEEFEKVISDINAGKKRPMDWEKAVRNALAISIRVKKDPERALKIINQLLDAPEGVLVPRFLRQDALIWKASLEKWKKEQAAHPSTEEGFFAEAQKLLARVREVQEYPADRSADVDYLRLTALMHEQLNKFPQGKRVSEALLLLGVAYESLRDLDLWDLHDLYYEACIRRQPESDLAKSCYSRLERSYHEGYSGTGGTSIPVDVQSKLNELRGLMKLQKF